MILRFNIKFHYLRTYLQVFFVILILSLLIVNRFNPIVYGEPVEGRSLDLYTQKGGEGPDGQGGEFMTGEMVYLISQVTYNDDPVANKIVSFEVRNPFNESVVFRTAITDQNGLAVTGFRIPGILSSNGTWIAISVVEIAEEALWDTVSFQVYLMIPVGGCSFPIKGYTTEKSLTLYLVLVAVLTTVFTIIKRKTYEKNDVRTKSNLLFPGSNALELLFARPVYVTTC